MYTHMLSKAYLFRSHHALQLLWRTSQDTGCNQQLLCCIPDSVASVALQTLFAAAIHHIRWALV